MVVGMKKAMFRYKMAQAGYPNDEIDKVEQWIESHIPESAQSMEREAILEYAVVCTDLSMVPTFVRLVDGLYRKSMLDHQESAMWVAHIISGWCK